MAVQRQSKMRFLLKPNDFNSFCMVDLFALHCDSFSAREDGENDKKRCGFKAQRRALLANNSTVISNLLARWKLRVFVLPRSLASAHVLKRRLQGIH